MGHFIDKRKDEQPTNLEDNTWVPFLYISNWTCNQKYTFSSGKSKVELSQSEVSLKLRIQLK